MDTPSKQSVAEAAGTVAGIIGAHLADTQRELDAETVTRKIAVMERDVLHYFEDALEEAARAKATRDQGPAMYDFQRYPETFDAAVTRAQALYTAAKASGASKRMLVLTAQWLDEYFAFFETAMDQTRTHAQFCQYELAHILDALTAAIHEVKAS